MNFKYFVINITCGIVAAIFSFLIVISPLHCQTAKQDNAKTVTKIQDAKTGNTITFSTDTPKRTPGKHIFIADDAGGQLELPLYMWDKDVRITSDSTGLIVYQDYYTPSELFSFKGWVVQRQPYGQKDYLILYTGENNISIPDTLPVNIFEIRSRKNTDSYYVVVSDRFDGNLSITNLIAFINKYNE